MPCELVNSVMMSPQPPWLRIRRRKTVSVTPAMGARTVAGAIFTGPIWSVRGITCTILRHARERSGRGEPREFFPILGLSKFQTGDGGVDIAQQAGEHPAGSDFDATRDARRGQCAHG